MIESVAGIRLHYGSEPRKSHSNRGKWKRQMIERLKEESEESKIFGDTLSRHYERTSGPDSGSE